MDLHELRMQCLRMAFDLSGKPDEVLTAAQRLYAFVSGETPAAAAAAAGNVEPPHQSENVEVAAPAEPAVADPIAACGTALVMPAGGDLADAEPQTALAPASTPEAEAAAPAVESPAPSSESAAEEHADAPRVTESPGETAASVQDEGMAAAAEDTATDAIGDAPAAEEVAAGAPASEPEADAAEAAAPEAEVSSSEAEAVAAASPSEPDDAPAAASAAEPGPVSESEPVGSDAAAAEAPADAAPVREATASEATEEAAGAVVAQSEGGDGQAVETAIATAADGGDGVSAEEGAAAAPSSTQTGSDTASDDTSDAGEVADARIESVVDAKSEDDVAAPAPAVAAHDGGGATPAAPA